MSVLVVDDNATNRCILEAQLSAWHIQPILAADAQNALDLLSHAAAAGHPFPLALVDAQMPETDGFALIAEIQRNPKLAGMAILVLTSTATEGDSARCLPGGLVVGADSHAVTYGALNCFGTGIGSSDLAAILMCGEIWLRVPESIRVTLTGEFPRGIYAKDVALALARQLGADGATYQALEFGGPALQTLPLDDRLVLSNLTVEMGAKNGIFSNAGLPACLSAVEPDADAHYTREVHIALDALTPRSHFPTRWIAWSPSARPPARPSTWSTWAPAPVGVCAISTRLATCCVPAVG